MQSCPSLKLSLLSTTLKFGVGYSSLHAQHQNGGQEADISAAIFTRIYIAGNTRALFSPEATSMMRHRDCEAARIFYLVHIEPLCESRYRAADFLLL